MSLAEDYKLDLVANFQHLELLSAVLDRTLENVEARDMAGLSFSSEQSHVEPSGKSRRLKELLNLFPMRLDVLNHSVDTGSIACSSRH